MISLVNMNIRCYTGGMAQTNAYLLGENDNCILIDAPEGVGDWLKAEGATPTDILLTHQHYDHVQGVAELTAQGVRVHAHSPYDKELTLETLLQQSGIPLTVTPYTVADELADLDAIKVGDWTFNLAHVPGHAPDSLVFSTTGHAFVGDTLFANGIGRADLPGGDMALLVRGIHEKILSLDDDTLVLPGHGPTTTVAAERSSNPYLQNPSF